MVACSDESTYLTPGTRKISFLMPFIGILEAVRASVVAAPVGSPLILDLRIDGVSCVNPKLQIDPAETSSITAAQQALIAVPLLPDGSEVSVDINQVGSTIAGAGLKVYLYVRRS